MAPARRVEVLPLEGSTAGRTFFCHPQPSDATQIAELAPDQPCELFCHRLQTDQIILMRGSLDLVVLQGRRLQRITLREDEPKLVRIPRAFPTAPSPLAAARPRWSTPCCAMAHPTRGMSFPGGCRRR
ncbi:hypothetical protein [Cyanobium sp. ATX-6F1]|uniref:hypothetical protein n=1 Tax=Cyanobium sp. ATX-6F1 TaxID=3137388 RepID=UPI0039BECEA7